MRYVLPKVVRSLAKEKVLTGKLLSLSVVGCKGNECKDDDSGVLHPGEFGEIWMH